MSMKQNCWSMDFGPCSGISKRSFNYHYIPHIKKKSINSHMRLLFGIEPTRRVEWKEVERFLWLDINFKSKIHWARGNILYTKFSIHIFHQKITRLIPIHVRYPMGSCVILLVALFDVNGFLFKIKLVLGLRSY